MVAARDSDFLNDGTIDPFTGLAPAMTPDDQARAEAARRAQLQASARATANINNAPGGYASQRGVDDRSALDVSNAYAAADRAAHPRHTFGGALIRDPVTMGILAAPLGVAGAGLAIGGGAALGFGEGAAVGGGGSAAGSSAIPLANEATGGAMAGPGFSQASANAFNAAAAGNAVAGGTTAAGSSAAAAGMPWYGKAAIGAVEAAGPAVIQALGGGTTKAEKDLIAKQTQLAQEAQVRQGQQQDARMDMLGQQMLAFNPRNQMLAQMFGPQAAFQPEQLAQMAQGPKPAFSQEVGGYTGTDPTKLAAQKEQIRRQAEYDAAEAARRQMILGGVQAPGPGPAPIQMPAAQAARRY